MATPAADEADAETFDVGTFLFYLQHHLLGDLEDCVKESKPGTFYWYSDKWGNDNDNDITLTNDNTTNTPPASHKCVFFEIRFTYHPEGVVDQRSSQLKPQGGSTPQAAAEASSARAPASSDTAATEPSSLAYLTLHFGFVLVALNPPAPSGPHEQQQPGVSSYVQIPLSFQTLYETLLSSDIDLTDTDDNPMWIISEHLATLFQELNPSEIRVQQEEPQSTATTTTEGGKKDDEAGDSAETLSPRKFHLSLPLRLPDIYLDASLPLWFEEKGNDTTVLSGPLLSSFREGKRRGVECLAVKRRHRQEQQQQRSASQSQSQLFSSPGADQHNHNDDDEQQQHALHRVWTQALKRAAAAKRQRAKAAASSSSKPTTSATKRKKHRIPVPMKRQRAGTTRKKKSKVG